MIPRCISISSNPVITSQVIYSVSCWLFLNFFLQITVLHFTSFLFEWLLKNEHLTNPLRIHLQINKPFFRQPTQTTVKVQPFGLLNCTSHSFCWLYIHWLPFWKRRAAASHRWWKLSRRLLCVDGLLRAKCQLLSLFICAACHQRHSAPLHPPYFFPTDPDNQRGTEWPPVWDTEGEQTGE